MKDWYDQLSLHANKIFSKLLRGFRKAHIRQHVLFRLLQSWEKSLDNLGDVGTVIMNLPKAQDCIPHDLLSAKLESYGLDKTSLHLLRDYFSNR